MEQNQIEYLLKIPHEFTDNKSLTPHHDHLFKFIIIGETDVGKTCLMKRIIDGIHVKDHKVTVGADFGNFGMKIKNKIVKV